MGSRESRDRRAERGMSDALKRKAIILDTDPGIGTPGSDVDDGLAIALALLHPACELLGLTIVAGNVTHEQGLPNTLRLLEIAGRADVPVFPGATRPILRDPRRIRELMDVRRRQSVERFWDLPPFAPPTHGAAPGRAAEFIADTIRARPGEVTVVASGPLTSDRLAAGIALLGGSAEPRCSFFEIAFDTASLEEGRSHVALRPRQAGLGERCPEIECHAVVSGVPGDEGFGQAPLDRSLPFEEPSQPRHRACPTGRRTPPRRRGCADRRTACRRRCGR